MKRENKKFLWLLIGGFVLMVFASLFFGDAMESLQKFIGSRASEHADSSKNAVGVFGFVLTIAGGIVSYLGIAGLCSSNKGTPLKPNHTVRVLLATLACGGVFVLNCAIGALITGGRGHGGVLGILVLFAVIGWVWRAIVGDSNAPRQLPKENARDAEEPTKSASDDQPINVARPVGGSPIHNYANEYIGKRFEVKSEDGRFILDAPVESPLSKHGSATEVVEKPIVAAPIPSMAEPENPHAESLTTRTEPVVEQRKSMGTGESNLGCVIAGGLVVVIMIAVIIASTSPNNGSTQSFPVASTNEQKDVDLESLPEITDEAGTDTELSEPTKKKPLSFEERAKLVTICDDKRELPVEMLHESCWSPAQSNDVRRFASFWGVPFGMTVTEKTDRENDWYDAFGSIKHRYSFTPSSRPGEVEFFNFSVTPLTHKVWRIACIAQCRTLREAIEEVGRMRKHVDVHKAREEYFPTDGAWVVYTANTNRTIEIRVEEQTKNELYWVYAEAYDNRLVQTIETEGVSPDEDLSGLFGISFGETITDAGFTADPNNRGWYDFTPVKRFRTFQYFDVYVTPRSHTICKVRAQRRFPDHAAATAEALEVMEIFRTKYPTIPFAERKGLKEGWKEWRFTFRSNMEFQRTLEVAISPDNYVLITAIADSDYFDLYNRERYQDDVDKLKADVESL